MKPSGIIVTLFIGALLWSCCIVAVALFLKAIN